MARVKPGLGRGLDALIKPRDDNNDAKRTDSQRNEGLNIPKIFSKIPIADITPNPFQPRQNFDPEALEELKKSILTNGLIQPITVRKLGDGSYQLISGERRLRAIKDIGQNTIPAYILEVVSDELMLAMALIENIQREKLNAIEIGQAYRRLMDECNLTQEQIADKVGKDRSTVANSVRLLKLPADIQNALIEEKISMGHARALINLDSEKKQLYALKQILEHSLSVRKVEQLVKKLLKEDITNNAPKTQKAEERNVSVTSLEDSLRIVLGTKVRCKQKKDGAGEIAIEFYSPDELDRLLELFEIIKNNQ